MARRHSWFWVRVIRARRQARTEICLCEGTREGALANPRIWLREVRSGSSAAIVTTFATGRLNVKKQTCLGAEAKGRSVPCVDGSRLARVFFTCSAGRCSHVFGLFCAAHMTAGHNALRGSGPAHKLAFEDALAHVGCPDRRIDRLCITCCSPSQPSHHTGVSGVISFTLPAQRVPCSAPP